jgi:D-3-phosphoglycerate dehydrogenase
MSYTFLLDFDSTLISAESLEVMAAECLANDADAAAKRARIREITLAAMEGRMDFGAGLRERLALLDLRREQLPAIVARLRQALSASFVANRAFLKANAEHIHVLSGGFEELIVPVIESLGLRADRVHANRLSFDAQGRLLGCAQDNPLAHAGGKVALVRTLALPAPVVLVGDGWSDLEVAEAGLAQRFYAYTEHVRRAPVLARAAHEAPNFDEVLFDLGLRGAHSYPKNRLKVLLLENIHASAVEAFSRAGYSVETVAGALDEAALCACIADVAVLGLRSKTRLTAKALAQARRLVAVGAFCIGTNQIDLDAARGRGIAVFNAPYSNTRSVVELAIAEIILLLRGLPEKLRQMDQGVWDKSVGAAREVRGKTLGIVGYGNIGMQLSVLAEACGMRVLYHDLAERLALGTAQRMPGLHALLAECDAVSVHVDGRASNRNLFGAAEFAAMRAGSVFLNLARGHVVDLDALKAALDSGHLRGAALDVFPEEPARNGDAFTHPLRENPRLLLTPHIGGSTLEAQADIGRYVGQRLIDYIDSGSTEGVVNLPPLRLPPQEQAHRFVHLHANQPGVLARINEALSAHGANILGQYLKTDAEVGYVITDVDRDYSPDLLDAIRAVPHTLRFRVLY